MGIDRKGLRCMKCGKAYTRRCDGNFDTIGRMAVGRKYKGCGAPLCDDCVVVVDGKDLCPRCVAIGGVIKLPGGVNISPVEAS